MADSSKKRHQFTLERYLDWLAMLEEAAALGECSVQDVVIVMMPESKSVTACKWYPELPEQARDKGWEIIPPERLFVLAPDELLDPAGVDQSRGGRPGPR